MTFLLGSYISGNGGVWSWATIGRLMIITLGNIVGGLFIPLVIKLCKYIENKSKEQ